MDDSQNQFLCIVNFICKQKNDKRLQYIFIVVLKILPPRRPDSNVFTTSTEPQNLGKDDNQLQCHKFERFAYFIDHEMIKDKRLYNGI